MSEAEPQGWWGRLKSGLSRSKSSLGGGISDIFTKRRLDQESLQELEELLIAADLGVATAANITEALRQSRYDKDITPLQVRQAVAEQVARRLRPVALPFAPYSGVKPRVMLAVGVNGTGKTTTLGKLAAQFTAAGKSVMLVAADTFRAAAIDQLKIWGERTGVPVVAPPVGADPASVAFDALSQARENGTDIVLIDTAGRLQNKAHLMEELEKIVRVIAKIDDTAPHDTFLVLDATTGQNTLAQVEVFLDRCNLTGLVMTKLDGTARGGILVAVSERFGIPVHAIGVGEGIDDLQAFDPDQFARALVGIDEEVI